MRKGILQPMLAPMTPPKVYPPAMPTVGKRYRMPNQRVLRLGGATSSMNGPDHAKSYFLLHVFFDLLLFAMVADYTSHI